MDKLSTFREAIDVLDHQIITLLIERFTLVENIKEEKKKLNLPILDSNREAFILQKLREYPFNDALNDVFKTIMAVSKDLQKKV